MATVVLINRLQPVGEWVGPSGWPYALEVAGLVST